MLTSKFLASALATIATAGAIGVAIAQTDKPSVQQPNPASSATSETTTDGKSGISESTTSSSGMTTGSSGMSTGSNSTLNTQSGAGSTLSAEATPRADRN